MSVAAAREALAQAFVSSAVFDQDAIAWENVTFDPPKDKPWAKFTLLPTDPHTASLGDAGWDQMDALVQVDMNYPLDSGDQDAMADYDALKAMFKTGARFTSSGQVVIIRSCGRTSGRNFSGYYRVSVNIRFYTQLQR